MKRLVFLTFVLVTGCLFTLASSPPVPALQNSAGAGHEDRDIEAVKQSAKEFAEAYNRGDAKALAAQWTENGECRDEEGKTLIGRDAIEKEFAELRAASSS